MEITYREQDGYRLPNLLPPQVPEVQIGKYGRMRKQFLEQHRKGTFAIMLTSGTLHSHLAQIDEQAKAEMKQLTQDMMAAQGVTEELKASDQMKWVGLVNNIKSAAEEIVLRELIYS